MDYSIEKLERLAKESIATLEAFTKVRVPDSLKEALDHQWIGASESLGVEVFGELVAKDKARKLRTRAMTIEKANALLRDVEDQCCEHYSNPQHSILYLALLQVTALPRWVLTHAWDLWVIILPVLVKALKVVADYESSRLVEKALAARLEVVEGQWQRGEVSDAALGRASKDLFLVQQLLEDGEKYVALAAVAVAGIIAYFTYEALVTVAQNTTVFAVELNGVVKARNKAFHALAKALLPQRRRKTYRRRIRSNT